MEGVGSIIYSQNQDIEKLSYDGTVKNGMPHGIGILKFFNGTEFKGTFLNGTIFDFGILTYSENDFRDEIEYKGQFEDGFPHGIGEMKYRDETTFQGMLVKGKPQGFGTKNFIDGSKYEGIFQNGNLLDFGILSYSQNDIEGKKEYRGQLRNGELNGVGVLKYKDGSVYKGSFENGKLHGVGILFFKNSEGKEQYEGQFQNNQPDGIGTLKFKNRAMFQGAFSQGKITNYGVFTYPLNTNTEILYYRGQISNDGVANGLGEIQYKVSISSTFYAYLFHQYFCAKKLQSQNVTNKRSTFERKSVRKMMMKLPAGWIKISGICDKW